MIKSPHPKHTIQFLRSLTENRFISRSGTEFSPEEVTVMLIEKEEKKAQQIFRDELKARAKEWNPIPEITQFQSLLGKIQNFSDRARDCDGEKKVSTVYAPSFISPSTTFLLNDNLRTDLVLSASTVNASAEGAVQNPKELPHASVVVPSPVLAPSQFIHSTGENTMKKAISKRDLRRKTINGEIVTSVFVYTKKSLAAAIKENERQIQAVTQI